MKLKYPVYQPFLSGNEKKYVNECLDSTWISSKGKFITEFEDNFSQFLGIEYSTAVSNGTVALHTALLALGIGPEDEVIVPTFTYIASVNAIHYTGAKPIFVDSEIDFWQMDIEDVKKKITSNTKAIMAVHIYGHPCELDKLKSICDANNIFLIEDCAESFGSKFDGKYTGFFGDISTFSFFGNKTITTGEGGMVSTNNAALYDKTVRIKGQGLSKGMEYFHDIIGYNYRMTNICAAIGCAQLEKADFIIDKKREIADWYNKYLSNVPVVLHRENSNVLHTYWMYTILVDNAETRRKAREYLREKGIETRPSFHPVHSMPMYFSENCNYPVADNLGKRGINLPSYPDLDENDVKYISDQLRKFFNES